MLQAFEGFWRLSMMNIAMFRIAVPNANYEITDFIEIISSLLMKAPKFSSKSHFNKQLSLSLNWGFD